MSAVEGPLTSSQRVSPQTGDTPDLIQDAGSNEDNEDDLFGDDDDEEDVQPKKPKRTLDDPDLDSGDDLERADRLAETVEEQDGGVDDEEEGRPVRVVECDVPRINYPSGTEFYLVNLPDFLGIKHETFDPETFIPQALAHDGDESRQTSAYSTAMSSMFWRYDPTDTTPSSDNIQSSARLIRWSDNSLTLQLATKPTEQYKIATTGLKASFNRPKHQQHIHQSYDPSKDSYTFLAAAHQTPVIDLALIRALDATMKIHPSGGATDESELRLRQALAIQQEDHDPLARMKDVKEDPELVRKMAEQFEKERMRAQRKRENAEERMTTKRNNVLGRSGLTSRGAGAGGLSVAGLEDDEGMPMSRGKKSKMGRKTNRHGEIYSDDEDETLPRGRTREDEYDRDDDFLADSDLEPEQYEDEDEELLDDDEEEEDEGEEDRGGSRRRSAGGRAGGSSGRERKRERTPKRNRMDELTDADASGEEDTTVTGAGASAARQSPQQARKKRRVIDDDDDEEEDE